MEEKKSTGIFRGETVLTQILEFMITAIFLIIVVLTILLVILRYIFNTGIVGGNELMEYLFVYTTAIGAAIAIGKDEHIRIGFLIENRSSASRKITGIFGILCIALINAVFLYLSYTWISKVGGAESPVLRVPMRTVQFCVPFGCILAIIYCGFNAFRLFKKPGKES